MPPCFHIKCGIFVILCNDIIEEIRSLSPVGADRNLLDLSKIQHPGKYREPVLLFNFNKFSDKPFEFRPRPEIYVGRRPTTPFPVFTPNQIPPAKERLMRYGNNKIGIVLGNPLNFLNSFNGIRQVFKNLGCNYVIK